MQPRPASSAAAGSLLGLCCAALRVPHAAPAPPPGSLPGPLLVHRPDVACAYDLMGPLARLGTREAGLLPGLLPGLALACASAPVHGQVRPSTLFACLTSRPWNTSTEDHIHMPSPHEAQTA